MEIPSATTNKTMTVRSPSLLNPSRASSTEIMVEATKAVSAVIMTESAPMRSETSARNMKKSTTEVTAISQGAPSSTSSSVVVDPSSRNLYIG